jgi:hypothetical protein
MEGWGVSSEKDDAIKYEHDEITCKYELSALRDIILTISAVLQATHSCFRHAYLRAWLSSMIMLSVNQIQSLLISQLTYTNNTPHQIVLARSYTIW